MITEQNLLIAALIDALERQVGIPRLPIGTRVHVGSLRRFGTVVGPDGVGDDALAVRLDAPFPRGYDEGYCCASVDECVPITPADTVIP